MAEYIERLAAVSALISIENRYNRNRDHENVSAEALYKDLCDAEIKIGKIPAEEVAPVAHGHWKRNHQCQLYCSRCLEYQDPAIEKPYCSNCGAKMDKGVRNV